MDKLHLYGMIHGSSQEDLWILLTLILLLLIPHLGMSVISLKEWRTMEANMSLTWPSVE